jgi:hypothetical protein
LPDEQIWPLLHTVPHVPQFRLSLAVFVQKLPPSVTHVVSVPHDVAHVLFEQTRPLPQALLHAPQLLGSDVSSTQEPPQFFVGAVQTLPHMPELQT